MRHRVARLADLPAASGYRVEVDGLELALFRLGDRVVALDGLCPHRGAHLAFGELAGEEVRCPLHAWPFHVPSGRCTEFPEVSVRTFPAWVDGGEVFVEL